MIRLIRAATVPATAPAGARRAAHPRDRFSLRTAKTSGMRPLPEAHMSPQRTIHAFRQPTLTEHIGLLYITITFRFLRDCFPFRVVFADNTSQTCSSGLACGRFAENSPPPSPPCATSFHIWKYNCMTKCECHITRSARGATCQRGLETTRRTETGLSLVRDP